MLVKCYRSPNGAEYCSMGGGEATSGDVLISVTDTTTGITTLAEELDIGKVEELSPEELEGATIADIEKPDTTKYILYGVIGLVALLAVVAIFKRRRPQIPKT